jgi:hypothetical protein
MYLPDPFPGCSHFTDSWRFILRRSAYNFRDRNSRSVMLQRVPAVIAQVTMLLFAAASVSTSWAEDAAKSVGPLHLEILEITSRPANQLLTRLNSRVSLYLKVTNQSGNVLTLHRSQLHLKCDDQPCDDHHQSPPDPLLPEEQTVADGEVIEGWISFHVSRPTSSEPNLEFIWNVNDTAQTIDLNQVLRQLVRARLEHVGYQNRIAVLSINRTIDLMTMWVLDEQFRSLKKRGVERLVLAANAEKAKRLPGPIAKWLQLANGTAQTTRRTTVRGFPLPARFCEFHVTGFQYGKSTAGQIMHRNRELAVAAAARTLYERLSIENALKELRSSEAGIRRTTLECNIDRLPPKDLTRVLDSIESSHAADRQLILEMLDRISNPMGVESLRATLLSSLNAPPTSSTSIAPATAAVAAQTLVRCIVPQTDAALREVWAAAENNSSLQETMVAEILRTRDYRWTQLVSEFATRQLNRLLAAPAMPEDSTSGTQQDFAYSRILRDVLRFLHDNDRTFAQVAREKVPNIIVPDLQDELLRIVIDTGAISLAKRCLTARLDRGTITKTLLRIIHQLPDSSWTVRLSELYSSNDISKSLRSQTLMAAVRCATDEQLNTIIDNIDQLDSSARSQLFRQLAAMEYPRCPELLKQSLDGNEIEFGTALRHLPIGTSPEMLQLVINRYEIFLQTASDHGDLDTTAFRMAQQLLRRLIQMDHPEARRMVNRSLISPAPGLREEAGRQKAANDNRSRTRRQKRDIWDLKRDKKYAEAREKVDTLIEQDPFCADFLMIRASLKLRDNQVKSAYVDVVEASRLSPGDVITESTVALLQVRSGELQQGLDYAETVMKQVPSTGGTYYGWTLYNTACVYGRAIEQSEVSPEDQKQFLDRAIVLMHLAADAGISDAPHLLADPDLVTLHEHSEWSSIVKQITANMKK